MKKFGTSFLMIVLCVLCMMLFPQRAQAATIHKGIFIEGTDMAGKTADEAYAVIQDKIDSASKAKITFASASGSSHTVSPLDLGISWEYDEVVDYAINYGKEGNVFQRYRAVKDLERNNINLPILHTFSKSKIVELIANNLNIFNQQAVNSEIKKNEQGGFIVKSGTPGVLVDETASADDAYNLLNNKWEGEDITIDLICDVDEPLGENGDFTNISDIIGTFTTEFKKSGAARSKNVENGCRLIDGATLYPGEQFSVLEHLVPFNAANGYELAGSYMNGLVVDTFGGGICQVSTTLYNALLLAEVQIDVRQNHSMIVDYVPPSGDAAITEASHKDLLFTNNKDFPIYIEGIITPEKEITFNIYGIETRPANRVVSYRSEIIERQVADYESIIQDGSKPIGYTSLTSSHAGIKAKYIKTVTVDGVVESEDIINTSTYKMVPRTLVVGTASSNPDAVNQLQAAIATGSIDQTRAVAKAWAAAAQTPPQNPAGDP